MGEFLITAPDGRKFKVTGETAEGAAQAVAKMIGGEQQDGALPPSEPTARNDAPLTPTVDGRLYNADTGQISTPRAVRPQRDRFGDTTADAIEAPVAAFVGFGRGLLDTEQSPTRQALPEGMPEGIKRNVARAGDAGGAALTAAGSGLAFAAGTVGEMFGGSPTMERKLASDLLMMADVAAPELAGVSSTLAAASAAGRAARKLNASPTDLQRAARSADDLGITPSLGAGGKTRGMVAGAMEGIPSSGGTIRKDAARFVGEVERAFDDAVSRIGTPVSPLSAGEKLKSGVDQFVIKFRGKSKRLFDDVGTYLPDDAKISTPETVGAIREAIAPFKDNPEVIKQLGLDRWASIADDIETGLSWRAASDLRSMIGESIGKMNGPMASMGDGRLKMAYAKLTDDLEAAAKAAGPDAEKAWRRAQNYYRRGAERIEKALDKTIKADSPERAFEAFTAMAKADRASSDARRMFQIKASIPRQEWNDVAASIIDRMGKAKPGAQDAGGDTFSPAVFLTEWNRLSDEAKSVLLSKNARKEMNQLAEVAELAKGANAERNMSRTGQVVVGAGIGGAAVQAPVSTAAFLGMSWASAKGMTNPTFLRALNRMARGDQRQIKAIANGNGPLARDAATILRLSAADTAINSGANSTSEPLIRSAR